MKSLLYISAFVLTSPFASGQAITDNLLVHYPFSGNSNDISGNGNNGLVSNATLVNDRLGNANEAYYFNGVDSYIDMPNNPALKPSLPVSAAFWVKFDNLNQSNSIVFRSDNAQNSYSGIWVGLNADATLHVDYGDNTGNVSPSNRRSKSGTTPIIAGAWYHVAVVLNGPIDMEIYLDCENDGGTYSGSGGNIGYSSDSGSIGRGDGNMSGPSSYLQGTLDNFMYWDRALVASDIDTLCNALSINENSNASNSFSVTPNPAKDKLAISGISIHDVEKIYIFDSKGRLISTLSDVSEEIDLAFLDSGLYFISLELLSGTLTQPFIKE